MKKPRTIFVSSCGQIVAGDENGQQIAELQTPLPILLAQEAEKHGWDLDGVQITGAFIATPFRQADGEGGHRWNFNL